LERGTFRSEARSGRTTRTWSSGRLRAASRTWAARAFHPSSTAFDHFRRSTGTSRGRRFVGAIVRQTVVTWDPLGAGGGWDARSASYGPAAWDSSRRTFSKALGA